jgi:hypothetical protein
MKRICKKCSKEKNISEFNRITKFNKTTNTKNEYAVICKECVKKEYKNLFVKIEEETIIEKEKTFKRNFKEHYNKFKLTFIKVLHSVFTEIKYFLH